MATNDNAPAHGPVLVMDVFELHDYIRELEGSSQDQRGGYSESYTARKTDISGSVENPVTASRVILGGDVRSVMGWAVAETTGAAGASLRLHDGGIATGEQFVRLNLAANESVRDWFEPKGLRCFTGRVFLEILTGSVEGVLFWR